MSVSPTATTAYTLTATDAAGSVTSTQTVTVNTPPTISSFTPSPATITSGSSSTLELDNERSGEHCHHAGDIQVHIGERFHERKSNGDDSLHADSNRCRRLSHLYANRYG
jgi:hypothetical protein